MRPQSACGKGRVRNLDRSRLRDYRLPGYDTAMARRSAVRQLLLVTFGILVTLYAGLLGMRVLWPIDFQDIVRDEAVNRLLPPDLVGAVIYAESRYRPDAVSSRGAVGLMQLMPTTAISIAESLGDPPPTTSDLANTRMNVRYGTWYLASLLTRFGNLDEALAAYNAGPTAVDRWRETGSEPFSETEAFVKRVLSARSIYAFYFRYPWIPRITPAIRL